MNAVLVEVVEGKVCISTTKTEYVAYYFGGSVWLGDQVIQQKNMVGWLMEFSGTSARVRPKSTHTCKTGQEKDEVQSKKTQSVTGPALAMDAPLPKLLEN